MGDVTSIRIPADQRYWLRKEARRQRTTMGAVIRQAIDMMRERREHDEYLDRVIKDGHE
jgi:hypothetical protein